MKYRLTFCLSLICLYSFGLDITLQTNQFLCGTTTVNGQTGCNHNGTLQISVQDNPQGISILNISPITGGNFSFDVNVTPAAPQNAQLIFTIITSDDPTGCALPDATETKNITTACDCAITLTGLVTQESCFQCENGSVETEVMNGYGTIDYVWSTGGTMSAISNLVPGTYSVTATDIFGCEAMAAFDVTAYTCAGFSILASVQDAVCFDDCNGSIQIHGLSNGSSSFSVVWNEGQTSSSRTDLCAALYHVTITDQDHCFIKDSFFVQHPPQVTILIDSVVHATPASNGKVFFSIETDNDQNPTCQGCSCCSGFCGVCGEITNHKSQVDNLEADKYFIQLAYENGCIVTSDTFEVQFMSNIDDPEDKTITLYPNPANDHIYIINPYAQYTKMYSIIDITGKILETSETPNIPVNRLSSGLYFIGFTTKEGNFTLPFSIIR